MVASTKKMRIPSDLDAARGVEDTVVAHVAEYGYSDEAIFAIKLSLEEALNNAIRHGNGQDPRKGVKVDFAVDARRVAITITDEGDGFCPDRLPDPTSDENLAKPCGRGVMLMRAYMDEVRFNGRGNQVSLVKLNC